RHQKDSNWVLWQRTLDQGQIKQSAILPSFTGMNKPVLDAKGGISVQIPDSEKNTQRRQLTEQILELANQPEYAYLSDLTQRDDINWQQLILTDEDWDYKQQGLTPAGAAIVAIAVAYATAGTGSELALALSAKTGSVTLGAAGKAAFVSLAQRATISAINNQGDLKAVFKELGSDDAVKSMITSAVTAGLLEKMGGTDWAQKLGKGTQTTLDDRLFKNIIDSTASALVKTGIQGGSLSNHLKESLKSGMAVAIQGEAASHIKGLEDVNWILHKIAHVAAGCAIHASQKQCEAGAMERLLGKLWLERCMNNTKQSTQSILSSWQQKSKVTKSPRCQSWQQVWWPLMLVMMSMQHPKVQKLPSRTTQHGH
ncbi:DUF637 domain-containing protein, partial [Moraxella sp. Tifton1]|uniref:DUF637 domain-containing protein n=2 Tax=Moraxella oculi TaxID=2940516 RepID=UPI002012287A